MYVPRRIEELESNDHTRGAAPRRGCDVWQPARCEVSALRGKASIGLVNLVVTLEEEELGHKHVPDKPILGLVLLVHACRYDK